jgi:hypothetical protein
LTGFDLAREGEGAGGEEGNDLDSEELHFESVVMIEDAWCLVV